MASMLDNPINLFGNTSGWTPDQGIGGGTSLASAFNPVTGGATNAGPTSPGVNWATVAKDLQSLGQKDPSQGGDGGGMPSSVPGQVQSTIGRPSAPVSLNQLVQMLRNRTDAYMQSAMNPTTAKPVQIQRPQGLLGF